MGAALVLRLSPTVDVYPDLRSASTALAAELTESARAAVEARGRFRWVLSGGRTPLPLFELLAGAAGRRMPWGESEVFFADERCVPARDDASNFASVWSALLSKVPIPRSRVHRMRGEVRPASRAASQYARLVGPVPSSRSPAAAPLFDLVLLGIGPDGHTASLFPDSPALLEFRRSVISVRRAGQPPFVPRLTMTLPALGSAREVVFLVSGEDKGEALRGIFGGGGEGSARWPASRVRTAGTMRWFLDRAAARSLPRSVRLSQHR
jgi:6-phosphogluconolactonase